MFTLSDLKQTRIYQEAFQEGEQKGEQIGEQRALFRLINHKFGNIELELTAQIANLAVLQLDDLLEAILDFNNVDDLNAWLQNHI